MKNRRSFVPYDIAVIATIVLLLPFFEGAPTGKWAWLWFAVVPILVVWAGALVGGQRSGATLREYLANLRKPDPSSEEPERLP